MGRLFLITLEVEGNIHRCRHCLTHFAAFRDSMHDQMLGGRAFLFPKVANVIEGEELLVGAHIENARHSWVEIFCVGCGSNVGLKFVQVPPASIELEGKYLFRS